MKDLYDGHTYDLKTRVDIWTRMDVFPVEYGTFTQTFHLRMRFFRFITGVNFKWDYVQWRIITLLAWIDLWKKLIIYKVTPDPVSVGDCGKTGRENGAMECSNIGVRRGTYDAVKLVKGENSRTVRSYSGITREDVQTPLGKNRLIIP